MWAPASYEFIRRMRELRQRAEEARCRQTEREMDLRSRLLEGRVNRSEVGQRSPVTPAVRSGSDPTGGSVHCLAFNA